MWHTDTMAMIHSIQLLIFILIPQTVITHHHHHLFLSLYGWLMVVDISPTMEKSEYLHCQEYIFDLGGGGGNPGHVSNQILWDTRTKLFKTYRTVTNRIPEYMWTVWLICTLQHNLSNSLMDLKQLSTLFNVWLNIWYKNWQLQDTKWWNMHF